MILNPSYFVIFSAIFWLCYECAHGMPPKKIGEYSSSNADQQPISKETRKWLKQIIEFIDKNNPKQFNGIEENEQIKDENELNDKKKELSEKLKTSKKEVTREDVKNFFALLNKFLKDIELKMTKKLKKLETYNTFRIKTTIENEIKTPKKQKEIAKLEKCICENQRTNIEQDLLDKLATLEAILLFKKLQILNYLATDKKQKEINEYFDTYFYQKEQQVLKEEEVKLGHAMDRLSKCPQPCFATEAVYKADKTHKQRKQEEKAKKEKEEREKNDKQTCTRTCLDILFIPCTCADAVAYCAIKNSIDAVVYATAGLIDVAYCCGVLPCLVGCVCANEVKIEKNEKKQEKIEKHLKEITPPGKGPGNG